MTQDKRSIMSHVFISYSHEDTQYAHALKDDFEKLGFKTWLDEDIEHGARWFSSIEEAIKNCGAFVVIMTPEAKNSEWVEMEIMIARDEEKPIFPILLRGQPFPILINIQYAVPNPANNYLPKRSFYKDIQQHVPRKPGNPEKSPPPPLREEPAPFPQHTLIDIKEWAEYDVPGKKDFYGIAMLALAYEELGLHKRAIHHFRRANKLENRVRYKKWMSERYEWTELHHQLVEQIITDPDFWRSDDPDLFAHRGYDDDL